MTMDFITPLTSVLSAASSALSTANVAPGRVELVPGKLPAWDDCCAGQLYLRVIEIYPSMGKNSPFPQIDVSQVNCQIHAFAVHIGLGVIRCAATIDDNGNAPTPAEVTADGHEMLTDAQILLDVLRCTVKDFDFVQDMKLDRWQPQGAEGNCHGGEWGAYLKLLACGCE